METRCLRSRTPAQWLALVLAFVLVALLAAPTPAHAGDYTMGPVDITAEVGEDGSLSVTETRAFDFSDGVNGVFWDIPLDTNDQGEAVSVDVRAVSVDGRAFSWVQGAQSGDDGVYTVEEQDGDHGRVLRLKVFTPRPDGGGASVAVSYMIGGAVMNWSDTAELYWQFVGAGWAENSNDVTCTITFPQVGDPAGDGGFRAWAHGPLGGNVEPDSSSRTVRLAVPRVGAGESAEARVTFPSAWVPGMAASSLPRLDTVLEQEEQWAAQANERRERARWLRGALEAVALGLSAAFAAAMVLARLIRGRGPAPTFTEEYLRDLPSDEHPAVLSRFWRGKVGNEAFVASLMRLADNRALALDRSTRTESTLFGGERVVEDYGLVLRVDLSALEDEVDRLAVALFFGEGAQAGDTAGFQDMRGRAKDDSKTYANDLEEFASTIDARLECLNLVASTGLAGKIAGSVTGLLVGAGALALSVVADKPEVFAACLMLVAVGVAVGFTFKRYTQQGVDLKAKCAAFKKWIEDFTLLNEAVPGDVVLWNKLLVCAVALGVSQKVLEELSELVPRDDLADDDGYYYPTWWWCHAHGDLSAPMGELDAAYGASLSSIASSSDSSGGGFGGGFSGGGGGGVGGGGGGTF